MASTAEMPPPITPTVQPDQTPLVRYSVTDAMIAKYREDFGKLIITDSKTEAAVRSALTTMVRTRTGIEAEYKKLTADANERIKLIRTEKNRIIAELAPTEEHLRAEWDRVEAERAKKKAEAEAAKAKAIQDQIDAANAARQAELDRQAAELAAAKAKQDEENRIMQEKLAAAQKRLEEQQAAAKAKADEEARIAREQEEKARREREAAEAKEREERRQREEAAAKAERDRLAKIEAEQRAERERLAEERRKIEAEAARIKAEQDAKELAERLAREAEERRIAELERAAALKAREEALRPDKKKLATWAKELLKITPPKVSDAEAAIVVGEAMAAIRNAADQLEEFAKAGT